MEPAPAGDSILQATLSPVIPGLNHDLRFFAAGSRYHPAVAGGPLSDLALSTILFKLRVGPTRYREVVPTSSGRLSNF